MTFPHHGRSAVGTPSARPSARRSARRPLTLASPSTPSSRISPNHPSVGGFVGVAGLVGSASWVDDPGFVVSCDSCPAQATEACTDCVVAAWAAAG